MNKRCRKRRAMHPKAAARWLKTTAAASYANVSPSTMEKLRLTGRGPAYSKLGRLVVYDIAELDRWIEARRCTSTSTPTLPMTGGARSTHQPRS